MSFTIIVCSNRMTLSLHVGLTVRPAGTISRGVAGQRRSAGAREHPGQTMFALINGVFHSRPGHGKVVSARHSLDAAPQQQAGEEQQKVHIIFMVHGLFGSAANWRVISDLLAEQLDPQTTLLHVSCVNEYTKTYDGIDLCGERLVDEVREVVGRHPGLQRISFVGHSMGGLIARYCCGRLFDPQTQTICGLQPCHFISLATPHLGCDGESNPAQVPLLSWAGAMPAIGGGVQRMLKGVAVPLSSLAFRRSGQQFFLIDREGGGAAEPLLLRMTRDHPVEGHFYSALASFETRTAYANSSGDHLVGWANSSLRSLEQLPKRSRKGLGVVREDPLEVAWHPSVRARLGATRSAAPLFSGEGHTLTGGDILRSDSPEELASSGAPEVPKGTEVQQAADQPRPGLALTWQRQQGSAGGHVGTVWQDAPGNTGFLAQAASSDAAGACEQGGANMENGGLANGDGRDLSMVLPLLVPFKLRDDEQPFQSGEPAAPPPEAQSQQAAGIAQEQLPGNCGSSFQQEQHSQNGRLGRLMRCTPCGGGEGEGGPEGLEEVTGRPVSPAGGSSRRRWSIDETEGSREGSSARQQRRPHSEPPTGRASGPGSSGGGRSSAAAGASKGGLAGSVATALGSAAVSEEPLRAIKAAAAPPMADPDKLRPGTLRAPWHGPPGSNSMDQALGADRGEYVEEMLRRLQTLSWRRVDVCFGRSLLPFLAHQHLQVQRWWLNWEGIATARHLAMQLRAMEELRRDLRQH